MVHLNLLVSHHFPNEIVLWGCTIPRIEPMVACQKNENSTAMQGELCVHMLLVCRFPHPLPGYDSGTGRNASTTHSRRRCRAGSSWETQGEPSRILQVETGDVMILGYPLVN